MPKQQCEACKKQTRIHFLKVECNNGHTKILHKKCFGAFVKCDSCDLFYETIYYDGVKKNESHVKTMRTRIETHKVWEDLWKQYKSGKEIPDPVPKKYKKNWKSIKGKFISWALPGDKWQGEMYTPEEAIKARKFVAGITFE
jgi:hypothetical protein